MKFKNDVVFVYYSSENKRIPLGTLVYKNRRLYFQYETSFLKTNLELSPFKLPLKPGIIPQTDTIFEGLFGLFNDSLPDGWGRLLLDRKLIQLGIHPASITPLDRLCLVGTHGMGALQYEPEIPLDRSIPHFDLDTIANEIHNFQENEEDANVDHLLNLGGSSGGARPKALLRIKNEDWIVKFRATNDLPDISLIEYTYHEMAKEAGLHLPCARLFPSKVHRGYFGVQRFDRERHHPIHMHSISGLLHADHQIPSLDYQSILLTTQSLTKDAVECEKQFRVAVFNILTHNRDDHSKNFSFLMDQYGVWKVAPAYDLTFSFGPGSEHSTMVMGEGRNPTRRHLLELAAIVNIAEAKAICIIEEVAMAAGKWMPLAQKNGVTRSSSQLIHTAIESVMKFII